MLSPPLWPLVGLMALVCLPAAALAAETQPTPPQPPAPELTDVEIGFDLVPFIGTSARYRGWDRRALSLNVVGYSGAIDGFEASVAAGLVHEDVDGLQASAGVNIVGADLNGLQGAGGANLVLGSVDGLQGAGGANVVLGDVDGLQLAGGANIALGRSDGLQATGGLNLAGEVEGMQMAPVNVASGHVDGLQLGVLNVARTSRASLGLVNIIWKGRTHLDGWIDESSFGTVALKHGSDAFHNFLGASVRPFGRCPEWALLYGLGGHADLSGRLFTEVDALARHVSPMGGFVLGHNDLYTARVILGLQLFDGLALTGGLSYNAWVSTFQTGGHYSPLATPDLSAARQVDVRTWPGFSLGVQLLPRPEPR